MRRGRGRNQAAGALLCAGLLLLCASDLAGSPGPGRPWGARARPAARPAPPRPQDALDSPFAVSRRGDLQVTCAPGVRVYVDGRFRGRSFPEEGGLYVEGLPEGTSELRAVKPGYRTQTTEVDVLAGRTVEIVLDEFELEVREAEVGRREAVRIQRDTGDVLLRSVPLRCTVSLLGRKYRKTRDILRLENLPAGTHALEVERDGRVLRARIPVVAGQITWAQAHFRRGRIILPVAEMLARPRPGRRVTNALGMTLAWVPTATGRRSRARLGGTPAGLWVAELEVTQDQYSRVMGAIPSVNRGGSHPADSVTYEEAREFCRRLTAQERTSEGLPPGWSYRLPSPGEWEAALSAGGEYPQGEVEDAAWLSTTSGGSSQPGGLKRPSPLGLHDLLGNLWEWCESPTDPLVPREAGGDRPLRGGSWLDPPSVYEDVPRLAFDGRRRHAAFGFRCVVAPDERAWSTGATAPWDATGGAP